jgi:16S rRNA (uracil1498-N3)-methyltransferase
MSDRYFVDAPIEGDQAILAGSEAHHLAHVMRAKAGDLVTLFDGSGAEFSARVARVGRALIELAVLSRAVVDRELPLQLTLGIALPKGERQRWLVEKATELGVHRLVPLTTAHSHQAPSAAALGRLRRTVIEASKQCGRNRLMHVAPRQALADFLTAAPCDALRLIAQVGAPAPRQVLDAAAAVPPPRELALAIGPEGGFSAAETELATAAGWQPIGLGRRVLRVETAALALVAAVVSRCE